MDHENLSASIDDLRTNMEKIKNQLELIQREESQLKKTHKERKRKWTQIQQELEEKEQANKKELSCFPSISLFPLSPILVLIKFTKKFCF